MKRTFYKTKNSNSFVIIILLLSAIMTSGHVFAVLYSTSSTLLIAIEAIVLFLHFIIKNQTMYSRYYKILFLIIATTIISLVSDAVFGYNIRYSIKFFITITFSFLFIVKVEFLTFRFWYVRIMLVICTIALIGYIYGMTVSYYYPFSTMESFNNTSYYNAYVFYALNTYSRGRNIGVFWEPGNFAIFITIAILFYIFDSKKAFSIPFVVMLMTLFTTYSTTGYVFIAIIIVAFASLQKDKNRLLYYYLLLLAILFATFFLLSSNGVMEYVLRLFPRVFGKLYEETGSTTDRINSIVYNLRNFLKYPLFGAGLIKANVLFSDAVTSSQTSSMTLFLTQFGLVGLAMVWFQLKGIIKYKGWPKTFRVLFMAVWVISMNVVITTFFSLFYILAFYFIEEDSSRT